MIKRLMHRMDLQAKISLVLVAVIVPTFLIVTLAEHKITEPILEEEIRQIGIHAGKSLAAEIDSSRMLSKPNPTPLIENSIQEILYSQPDIVRIDVTIKDPISGVIRAMGSSVEEDPPATTPVFPLVESVVSEFRSEEGDSGNWDILVPIEHRSRDLKFLKKTVGTIHIVMSTKLVGRISDTLWKTKAIAAAASVVCLLLFLSYFLRKTLENDRLLKQAEVFNLKLSEQLHEAQRQLMISEKLAVMGQLTASFAHELGTPLNAIGGHLQLLKEEIPLESKGPIEERLGIVDGQLRKIEGIVKGFLQSTSKPVSQKQLVDLNQLIDKTLGIVGPRIESLQVELKRTYDRSLAPMRLVPLDLEQILLNLISNSLDSIKAKLEHREKGPARLEVTTEAVVDERGQSSARISIQDTGAGIRKTDLKNVLKPFFTTKRVGEGTGLGLSICQQLVHKYSGQITIDSKEGAWTRVTVQLPYHGET